MAEHRIEIQVNGNDAVPPNPLPHMDFGDTVRYFSKAGAVKIVFPGLSPFRTDNAVMTEVTSSDSPTVQFNGKETVFGCRCFVKLSNGTTVGWGPGSPLSGGDHHVGH